MVLVDDYSDFDSEGYEFAVVCLELGNFSNASCSTMLPPPPKKKPIAKPYFVFT